MKSDYIHGYPFYTFQVSDDLVDSVLEQVIKLDYKPINLDVPSLLGYNVDDQQNKTSFYDKRLYDFFDSCLEPIYKKHFTYSTTHVINDLWATKTKFGGSFTPHIHSYSVFSGLLYLQNSKTGTIFSFPDRLASLWGHFAVCNEQQVTYVSESIKGKLLIWPSCINHRTAPHKEKESRYSIAFNSFWNGRLYDEPSGFLEVATVPAQNLTSKSS